MSGTGATTARPEEIARFGALASRWWDRGGPMAPLHAMNPVRCAWVAERVARAAGRGAGGDVAGLRVLDVGCGAGIAAEWFAARGAVVTGLDAAGEALAAARVHAAAGGLDIAYVEGAPEGFAPDGGPFDAVLALEVVEHVEPGPPRAAFLAALARLARPGGGVVALSTLNRTARSFALAKVGAEYVLRLLPRGTHDWRLFPTPSELGAGLRAAGLRPTEAAGMTYDLAARRWRVGADLGVNYLLAATRP